MSKYGAADVGQVILGGYDILSNGVLTEFTDKITAVAEEAQGLGDAWRKYEHVGLRSAEFTHTGFYDDSPGSILTALRTNHATSPVLTYSVETNAAGKSFVGFNGALEIDYAINPVRGQLTKMTAHYHGNGIVEEGKVLVALAAKTATGNSTAGAVDFLTSGTSGGSAYLQVTAFTSGPSTAAQIDIMTSPDNLTFSSWKGFTSATAAPFSQRLNSAVALQRYNAVRWQGASNGASFPTSVTFFVGLART